MRLDKYLKVSRLIKRREAAKEFIDNGLVRLNGKIAKPSSEVKLEDVIEITSPLGKVTRARIKEIRMVSRIDDAANMYELLIDHESEQ
ncbi:MAG: RNA-binding S4 domain-containing protein [Bacilli bacterium]|nr:RNA-binding S4 domain-containing protein [Bacilli bacterium]